MTTMVATREAYGNGLLKLAEKYKDFVVLDADLSAATKTGEFAQKYPDRAYNLGIAEQNMMGFAVGLANTGLIPFAGTFAVFAAERAYDQIRQSIAYPKSNVKIVATHGGLTVGEDGATHQAIEDIAMMRALPDMVVIVPSDAVETEKALEAALKYEGPVYLRLGREKMPIIMSEDYNFEIGKAVVLKSGKDLTIIAAGVMVAKALAAAEKLKESSIDVGVINLHTIKPLDKKIILQEVEKTGRVITAEEHSVIGGLGSAVNDLIVREKINNEIRVTNVGIEDEFGQTGSADELLKLYDLTTDRLVTEGQKLMGKGGAKEIY